MFNSYAGDDGQTLLFRLRTFFYGASSPRGHQCSFYNFPDAFGCFAKFSSNPPSITDSMDVVCNALETLTLQISVLTKGMMQSPVPNSVPHVTTVRCSIVRNGSIAPRNPKRGSMLQLSWFWPFFGRLSTNELAVS